MKAIFKNKILLILVGIVLVSFAFYFIREYLASKEIYMDSALGEEYNMVPKVYGVNEYSITQVTDKNMTNIYLNDFISKVNRNIDEAYNLLNEEYRNKKFGSVENFKNYLDSIKYSGVLTKMNDKIIEDGKQIYQAYDSYGNHYIFKADGVMQYEVYLDEDTVEIW